MGKYIRTLSVCYDTPISQKEVHLFRGAILKCLGDNADILYHNHAEDESFRYSYPLIQYKRLRGKAAVVCVDKGVDLIGQYLTDAPNKLILGEKEINPVIEHIIPARIMVQTWEAMFNYHLSYWVPFNTKNFFTFKMISAEEQIPFLENILKANLLSMLKGLDIYLEKEIILQITSLSQPGIIYNKGIGMTSFNADFSCNLSIPNNLGIGKNASIGCGVIRQYKTREKTSTDETINQ